MMILLQRFDEQVIDRKPDGTAPVGVATEKPRGRIARFVVNAMLAAIEHKDVRMFLMKARERANAIRRKKPALVEHLLQNAS